MIGSRAARTAGNKPPTAPSVNAHISPSASFSQITFDYTVNLEMVVLGLSWALTLGTVGGLFPAVRAARLPITTALRGE